MLGLALSAWAATAAAECLPYEPTEVTLAGVVKYRERAAILELESPVCVRSRQPDDPGVNAPRDNVQVVQLMLLPSISRPSPDRRIVVTGTLSVAQAAHHRTWVLLYVRAIEATYESR